MEKIETLALTIFGVLAFVIAVGLVSEVRDVGQRVNARVAAVSK